MDEKISLNVLSMSIWEWVNCAHVWKRSAKAHRAWGKVLALTLKLSNATSELALERAGLAESTADKRLDELRQIKILIDNWSSSEADLIATIYTLVSKDIEEIPG